LPYFDDKKGQNRVFAWFFGVSSGQNGVFQPKNVYFPSKSLDFTVKQVKNNEKPSISPKSLENR